jgi:F0F1-type ATP synthase assembly protein I
MKKIILNYGLYSGAVSAILMAITTYSIKQNGISDNGALYGYAGMILSMVFVYLGVRLFRERERNGVISFGEAFKVGGLIALISCACYVVTWLLMYEFFLPDFMEQYITYSLDKMKAAGKPEVDIEQARTQMADAQEMYKNPLYRVAFTFIEPLPVALLMSLVSAIILKKKVKT